MCEPRVTLWLLAGFAGLVTAWGDVSCQNRTRLDACLHQLPQILSPGIPSSKEEVDVACRAFKTGMQCFDQYVDTCFNGNERDAINMNVAGARKAFARLCDDSNFQEEYLHYAPCYHNISKDWDTCASRFLKEAGSSTSASTQTAGTRLCCARNAFLDCVYASGNLHCSPDAARFLRQMADMLSNAHVYNTGCQHTYTPAVCSAGVPLLDGRILLLTTAALGAKLLCARA